MEYDSVSLTVTIVILAILTFIIFAFAIVAFSQIYKTEKSQIADGKRDEEIRQDKEASKKVSYKVINIVTTVFSYLVIAVGVGLMCFSLYAKSQGQITGNNLVIASGSMSQTYDPTEQTYVNTARQTLQFKRGDILKIDKLPTLEEMMPKRHVNSDGSEGSYIVIGTADYTAEDEKIYQAGYRDSAKTYCYPGSYVNDYLFNSVFAYYNKNSKQIIVHRLVYINYDPTDSTAEPTFMFRGDANGSWDPIAVHYSDLRAVYSQDNRTKGIGYAVLFFQDGFGIYSIIASLTMMIVSSIFIGKIQKDHDNRYKLISGLASASEPDKVPGQADPEEPLAPAEPLPEPAPSVPEESNTPAEAPTEPVTNPTEAEPVVPPQADEKPTEASPETVNPAPAEPSKSGPKFVGIVASGSAPKDPTGN
jgi:hypothetical protein